MAIAAAIWESVRLFLGLFLVLASLGIAPTVGDPRVGIVVVAVAPGLGSLALWLLVIADRDSRLDARMVAMVGIAVRSAALAADLLTLMTIAFVGLDTDLRIRGIALSVPVPSMVGVIGALDLLILVAILWTAGRAPAESLPDPPAEPSRAIDSMDAGDVLPDFEETEVEDAEIDQAGPGPPEQRR